jgi:hypothetical protein
MALKKIVLNLARTAEFPEGSNDIGYEFYAPLDSKGYLDKESWQGVKNDCTVLRFWKGQEDEKGYLIHHRGNKWLFDYDPTIDSDDEPIFRFDDHKFLEGEYISITEHDGIQRPFKVISVS